jgi:hypothetical protein
MINYYFFQFIKKNRTVSVLSHGGPAPGGDGTDLVFSNLNRLEPARMDRAGP